MFKLEDFSEKQRVAYIPNHADNDINHEDVEYGYVSSVNDHYVFVKFDKQLQKFGWEGTTSQSCRVETLVILSYTD
jgi:hypothetical protein